MNDPAPSEDDGSRRPLTPRLCAAASIVIGVTGMAGWAFEIEALKSVFLGLITMKPNTALGFILAGVALGAIRDDRRRNRLAAGLAVSVAILGALTLFEYLSGLSLGIDQILFHEAPSPRTTAAWLRPGRMHPATALDFVMIGVALALIARDRGYWAAHSLALLAAVVAGSAAIGYLYGIRWFVGLAAYNQMAVHTAIGMLTLALGALTVRPGRAVMATITGDRMARRLIPVAILVPIALDGLALLSNHFRLFDERFATAVRVTATIAIFVGVIVRLALSRIRLDREVRRSDQTLRLLADSMPQLAWMAGPDGHISWYNRRWYEYTGTTPEQMEGWGWQSVHDPAALPGVLARWTGCIASGEPFEMVFPLRGADGHFRQFLTRIEASRGDDGRILHWFGTNTDIQEQKRAEEELHRAREGLERRVDERTRELAQAILVLQQEIKDRRRAEDELRRGDQQFRTLADSIPQLAWMARPDGYIFWYNRRWFDYTGTTLEQMQGWGWQSVHDPAELPRVVETIKASFASGEPWDCTFPIRRHDGVFRWHLSRMLPVMDEAGRVTLWFGSNTDITEQKQLESALREGKEAAEAATRAKGDFLANMSHEIRTSMNGILGMTELTLGTELTPCQRESLGLVKSSADALLTVIDDILDFSKIEAGKLALDPVPFGLRDAVDRHPPGPGAAGPRQGPGAGLPDRTRRPRLARRRPGRLRQVLVNLVGNAIKFTERGEVCVEVGAGPDEGTGREIRVAVADTGIGIPAHKRAAIFAPFEQADGSTTRKYGGTGLGLSISCRLVELMGGRIGVEDNPGGGSLFRFTVRLAEGPEPLTAPGRHPAKPSSLAGLRVLVVDDNRSNRLILEELLTLWGCRPTTTSDGPAALQALAEAGAGPEPFGVVLLDRAMPGMDGCALAARIGADPALRAVKMLMLTCGGVDESARFHDLGIGAWLTKPIRQSELFDALLGQLAPASAPTRSGRPAHDEADGAGGRRLRVLLAEDHPINQKVATRLLERQGHAVTVVGDGRAAVEVAGREDFDVALMDIQMPEMDGFEALAAIRSRERVTGHHLPVVALTAHAMEGDRDRCLASGFDDYLSKPIQAAGLRSVLDRLDVDGPGRHMDRSRIAAPAEFV